MNIQPIALAKLKPSKSNVRKTGGQSIADLAASIHSTGLLQNLTVIAEGKTFEVICGSRRLAALRQLVKDGKLPSDYAAPCAVVDDTTNAIEASLAENTIREAMHPADQFDAFRTLALGAATPAEIGARFGVSELFVKQRLKLANVSPKLLMEYRTGNATLDQMQALAITDDHAAQERVWGEAEGAWQRAPDRLRNHLTEREIGDDDSRVRFIGLEAYENAGGVVRRDLFGEHAYIADEALLDRLVNAKLNSAAAGVRAEGWAWVEAYAQPDGVKLWGYPSAGEPKKRAFTAEEKVRFDAATARRIAVNKIIAALPDDHEYYETHDHPLDLEKDEIQAEFDALQDVAQVYSAKLKAASGALVFISDGKLCIERARLKPGAKPGKDGEESTPPPPEKPKGGLSQAAVEHLYGIRTGILRNVLLNNPKLALAALISGIGTTGAGYAEGVVKIRPQHTYITPPTAEGIEAHAPQIEVEADFECLLGFEIPQLLEMLVSLAAKHVIAGHEGGEFARLAGINIAEHWHVSEEWLAKQSKAYILAALREIDVDTPGLDKFKAAELATNAAPALLAAGWLPEPFREDME